MSRYILDIESDGLLQDPETNSPRRGSFTQIWCIVLRDVDSDAVLRYYDRGKLEGCPWDGNLEDGLREAQSASLLVTHGGQGFDLPACRQIFPWFKPVGKHYDTLVGARSQFPHIRDRDFRFLNRGFPKAMIGRHTLEAWGHRLNVPKDEHDDWSQLSEEMLEYCVQDTATTLALFKFLMSRGHPAKAHRIEHEFAEILQRQMVTGVGFDEVAARALVSKLERAQQEIEEKLREDLPPKVKMWMTPKQRKFRCKEIPLNLNSRTQVAQAIQFRYGWQPTEYNAGDGTPKFGKETLEAIHPSQVPCVGSLREFYKTADVLGTLAYGKKALLQHSVQVAPGQWRIHGYINHCGARTSRCTHQVVANIPRVGSTWGLELRSLFIPRPGWRMVGADMSGIEARGLAHYLEPYDGGALIERILGSDIHTQNWEAVRAYGVETRQDGKNVFYAYIYGASQEKLGIMVGRGPKEGRAIAKALQQTTPGLVKLLRDIKEDCRHNGYLIGLDGRKIFPSAEHAAPNAKIQGFGGIVMKVATKIVEEELRDIREFYEQVIHYHDEYEFEAHPDHAERVRVTIEDAIREAGVRLGVKCPLAGEGKVGDNWAEVH